MNERHHNFQKLAKKRSFELAVCSPYRVVEHMNKKYRIFELCPEIDYHQFLLQDQIKVFWS